MISVVEVGTRRTLVVAAVMLAAVLQLADTTIVNVALPTIDGSLGASTDEGTWFVTSYIIANVVVIPLSPFFVSTFGRRNYFTISIIGFTILSACCGFASDTNSEIAFRFLQGAFGGGLMVPAQQIMRDTFPPSELGKSQSLFGLAVVMGPTIGPSLGGILTDNFSWNWVFFINLLPGAIAAGLAFAFIRDPEAPKRAKVDGVGVGLLAAGLGSLQYVLEEGERNDWLDDVVIRGCLVLSIVSLIGFVVWELRALKPAVDLRVLASRDVATTVAVAFTGGFVLYGLFILQPLYTQNVLGCTTTESGLFMMVRAFTILSLYPVTTWIVSRPGIDLRFVVGAGLGTYSISALWLAQLTTTTADFDAFIAPQVLGGIGLAIFFVPLNIVLLRALRPAQIPASLALQRLFQQLGGSVASASLITYADHAFAAHDSVLRSATSLASVATRAYVGAMTASHHAADLPVAFARIVAAQDQAMALADATLAVGIVGLIATPLVLVFRPSVTPVPGAPTVVPGVASPAPALPRVEPIAIPPLPVPVGAAVDRPALAPSR